MTKRLFSGNVHKKEEVVTLKEKLDNLFATTLTELQKVWREIDDTKIEMEKKITELRQREGCLSEIRDAARSLRHDWMCATVDHWQSGAWFFVRSFQVDASNWPVSYDAFWAMELIDDLAKAKLLMAQVAEKDRQSTGPYFEGGLKRLGGLSEASRSLCPQCNEEGCVVGWRELSRWDDGGEDKSSWRLSLYVFCVNCPRLSEFARRGGSR